MGNDTCYISTMRTFAFNVRMAGLAGAVLLLLGGSAFAGNSAFDLVKLGNRYVGEQSRDKVSRIASEKSIGTITPSIWVVTYFDSIANQRSCDVKFGAGKMMSVKNPLRPLDHVLGSGPAMVLEELKVDSDTALKTAIKQPLLESIKITSTQLELRRTGRGKGEPVWTVTLWANKVSNTTRDAKVGEVQVSAIDGRVTGSDIQPSRLE